MNKELIHHSKEVLRGSLAFMQHFKFENWRIRELKNSIFDVTNRLKCTHLFAFLSFSWFILVKDPMHVKLAVNPSHKLKDWRLMSAFIQVINMLTLTRGVPFSFPLMIFPLYPKHAERGSISKQTDCKATGHPIFD